MAEPHWVRVVRTDELVLGRGRFAAVGGHELAIFRLADPGRYVVVENACPHAGGNLAAGEVRAGVVTCPWHEWKFNLNSGRCTLASDVGLTRYECRVEDGYLWALLPGA